VGSNMGRDSPYGQVESIYIMDITIKVRNTEQVLNDLQMRILKKGINGWGKDTEMGSSNGLMGLNNKGSGEITLCMDKEFYNGQN